MNRVMEHVRLKENGRVHLTEVRDGLLVLGCRYRIIQSSDEATDDDVDCVSCKRRMAEAGWVTQQIEAARKSIARGPKWLQADYAKSQLLRS